MQQTFSIGRLAGLTGCKVVTIRYYEQIGILPAPHRSAGGHRVYDTGHLERLTFIRRARDLGFSLEAVRSLLALSERPDHRPCEEVDRIASARLAEVKERIADLRALEHALERLLNQCAHTSLEECRVLDAFRAEVPPRGKMSDDLGSALSSLSKT